jgi:DNA-binding MurR/RpiR family transcriptional regulator
MQQSFEQQLSGKYATLSIKLRAAADYVVANPVNVATRSLRSVSKEAKLSPATFSRMSAALGYASYEDLRDALRGTLQQRTHSFTAGVDALQNARPDAGGSSFPDSHAEACAANVRKLGDALDRTALARCLEQLEHARRVVVTGVLGSECIAAYLTHMASFVSETWRLAGCRGISAGSDLAGLGAEDVLIVITKPPFAHQSVEATRIARRRGASVIVITDTHSCPALVHATAHFVVPSASPHFYSSYASTLVLCEIMIGMLAARAGSKGRARIADVENVNRRLSSVWGD